MGDLDEGDDALNSELEARWREVFTDASNDEGHSAYSDVWYMYAGDPRRCASAGRHYHNLRHVRDCFAQMDRCVAELDDPRSVAAAIWFHDAVYDSTRSDNEARSANLAEEKLRKMGEPEALVAKVHDLILDTRHIAPPTTSDGRFLVDIDLAILGGTAEEFDAYDRAIRREYAHVPEDDYRVGRAKVLRSFLAREFIYHTGTFRDLYESAARGNLARAIARLSAPFSTSR